MSESRWLDGPRLGPASGGRPRQLVVLLHGVGADGHDLIRFAPAFAAALPDAAFAAPHAPFPNDRDPVGHQWFSVRDRRPEAMLAGARMAAPILERFIAGELACHGLDDDGLALVGFSQGAMMALHVGLRRKTPCAGIIGYGGMLLGPELLAAEIACRPSVLLVHGEADEQLPADLLREALAALTAGGVRARGEVLPAIGHVIADLVAERDARFLAEVFAALLRADSAA